MIVGDKVVVISSGLQGVITAIVSNGEQAVVYHQSTGGTATYYFKELRKEVPLTKVLG